MIDTVLALDIGTSSACARLVDRKGRVLASGQAPLRPRAPRPGRMEQDVPDLLRSVTKAVRSCLRRTPGRKADPAVVVVGAPAHSLAAVDAKGRARTPLLLGEDRRAHREAAGLVRGPDADGLYQRTGCPMHPAFPLVKLLWLKKHAPDLFAPGTRFVSAKAILLRALAGREAEDESSASASGLANLVTRRWDPGAAALAGLRTDRFPEIVPVRTVVGGLAPAFARATGLAAGTPVVAGATDSPHAVYGLGAEAPGVAAAMLGDTAAIRTVVTRPKTDPRRALTCGVFDEGRWLLGAETNNGGNVLDWFRETMTGGRLTWAEMGRLVARRPAGPVPVLAYPFLHGERSPVWDPRRTGAIIGLRADADDGELAAAFFQGIAFGLRHLLGILEENSRPVERLLVSGDAFQNPALLRRLADALGRTIEVPATPEASALGAARLGVEALDGGKPGPPFPLRTRRVTPDPRSAEAHAAAYRLHRAGLDALAPLWAAVGARVDLD